MNMSPSLCESCPTRALCLACGLHPAAMRQLSGQVHPTPPLGKGDYLYRAGDPAGYCYLVRSGVFKTVFSSTSGEERVTGFHYPGELLGLTGQACGSHRESARALDTSTACRIRIEDIPALWKIGSGTRFLRLVGLGEQAATLQRINLGQSSADRRVAGFLTQLSLQLRHRGRDRLVLDTPMSRTDLANYLGMSLECLSRVLARFRKAGLIVASRHQITLTQPDRLADLADHLAA